MEIEGTIASEVWVLLTPPISASMVCEGLDNDMGSLENPQMSQILEKPEEMKKENDNFGCKFGNSSSSSQEINHKSDGFVSNTEDEAKISEDLARKNGFMVSENNGNSFETLRLHGISGNNSPHQETIEVEPFECGKGSQLDNQTQCEFGSYSTKTSSTPKNQIPKKRSNKGITLNKMPRKRLRKKKHRPKVLDEIKPKKPSTSKPKPSKRAKYVKKVRVKTPVDPLKDVDNKAVSDRNVNYGEQKLESSMGICIMNEISKDCDGLENKPEEEPKADAGNRFSSLRVYHRILRPNECLKNSRKLGPICPSIFKKTRSRRQRASEFDKFVTLFSMTSPARKQRRAAMVARKLALMVSGDFFSGYESWELHGKPEGIMDGILDDRLHQETTEVETPFTWEKGSQLHNHYLPCEFEMNSTKASITPQTSKKRSNNGIGSNKKPRKRLGMKRHRPKAFDKSKPIKPSTPELRTPKRARYVKKDRLKTRVHPLKDVVDEAITEYNGNSCRHKLDFNMDNCIMNHMEPKLDTCRRFSFLKVYKRVLRPDECLKNSRKLGPNCPRIFKKTRLRRQRATEFDKFIMFLLTQEQERAEIYDPMVKDRKTKSQTLSQRQKSLSLSISTEKMTRDAIEHVTLEKCTFNLTWTANSKKKRSKRYTRRRDLSFFINNLSKIRVSETLLSKAQDAGIQKCPIKFGDCVPGGEIDLPKYSVGTDTLNRQVVKGQRVVANDMWEMGSFSDKYQCKYDMNDFPACFRQQEDATLKCTEHSLELDIATLYLVGPRHERANVLSSRDSDAFMAALVDFAIQRMERLHIDDRCEQSVVMYQNAHGAQRKCPHNDNGCKQLVVHQNAHGAVVPSTGKSDPLKKRKTLPKVDLDDETMRVWNLMENNGNKHTESEDDDKGKYWKEQRETFSGRADSFIARMHLFQGDRRFSPWKGSVLDSVVGVFLTQNVSDHLSSSSFMELASRYPPPSVSENSPCGGRTDHVIHEIQQIKIAKTSSEECEELSIMGKVPSSSPSHHVGVDPENENKTSSLTEATGSETKKAQVNGEQENTMNWDDLRKKYSHGTSRKRPDHTMDSVNWEAVRKASVHELAQVIITRGMHNTLAGRIKDFLDRIVRDHGSIDLEWLRDVPPDKVKDYLLSIPGLGLKSAECVRLLTLHHHAFPVDTNVGRILVRLGWVPLQPLPEEVRIHDLELYPSLDNVQKHIWPRVCHLPQLTLYELHYQMITFGKVFCTKRSPNCNACPMRAECKHYASALASQRFRLEDPQAKNMATESSVASDQDLTMHTNPPMLSHCENGFSEGKNSYSNCEPLVEIPASPEPYIEERDIEDFNFNFDFDSEHDDEIPTIKLNNEEFTNNLLNFVDGYDGVSKALVPLPPNIASITMPKLKDVNRLRTVHQVYELPDSHPLVAGFDKREPDDPCPYLLRIWMPDETANSSQESKKTCNCKESTTCEMGTCSQEVVQYQNNQIVRGTILIPCRTANRGSFPLNGTYFQVNEVFADVESSQSPIAVPRGSIWNLRRRSLYCGTSATSISRGMSSREIEYCFRRGFICIRAIDRRTNGAKPLASSFHWWKTKQVEEEKY